MRIHLHTNTHAQAWHCPHAEALILRPTIYAQICIHIHIQMYINACIYMYIHTCIYIHIYMSTIGDHFWSSLWFSNKHHYLSCQHTHIHICTHKHTKCTYARKQARLERFYSSDWTRSLSIRRKLRTSLSFDANNHIYHLQCGLHCTHFLRHQYLSTLQSLFPTYPRTVHGPRILGGRGFTVPNWSIPQSAPLWGSSAHIHNDPLRSCRKIGGKTVVQKSHSRRTRRTPRLRMTKVTVHEKQEVTENNQVPQQPITQSRHRSVQTTSANLCTGAGPIHPVYVQPMSLATEVITRNEVTFLPFSRAFHIDQSLPSSGYCSRSWTIIRDSSF